MPMSLKQELAAVLALVACISWVHAPTLTSSAHLTAHHDNLDGAAPLRLEAARQWKSGQLPLWNPYKRTGMPLLADTTAGAIYPGNFPFLFVKSPDGDTIKPADTQTAASTADSPVFRAMDEVAALHAVLAGLFMYLFLRVIALGAAASVLGAVVFACSGTMGWFAAWYIQIQNSVVWLPLILAAVHKVGTGCRYPAAWVSLGAAAVALQFFAGFPETSFYSALIAIGYALSLMRRDRRWQPPLAVASIYGAGLLLAAVQLFPALQLEALSRRPGTLSLEAFQSLPASASMVWSWMTASPPPGIEFPPLAAYHFGIAAVAAAAIGLVGTFRRSAFFVVVLAIGFVLSLGAATPVSGWFHALPGFGAFRHPFKHLFEVSFAMAALAALGADTLVRRRPSSRWPQAVVVVAIVVSSFSLRSNQAILIAANPAGVDTSGNRPDVLSRIEPGWRVLTPRRFFQKRDPDFLLGDYPSEFGVPAVHGAGPFLWGPLADATGMVEEETTFRRGFFDARDRTLALLSCRYVMQTSQDGKFLPVLDPATWSPVVETADARLVERKDALPRIRFVSAVRCSDTATIATTLSGGSVDPGDVALVDCSRERPSSEALPAPSSTTVRIANESPGHLELVTEVPTGGRAFVVVGQADYPGWQASIDGLATPIYRVHGLVQGVEVPGLTSRLHLSYMPLSFVIGAVTSAATAIVLLVASLVALVPRRPANR
jgi:hypothetical protein